MDSATDGLCYRWTLIQVDSDLEYQVKRQLTWWRKDDFGCPLYSRLVVLENGERINLQQYIYYLRWVVHLVLLWKVLISAHNFLSKVPEKVMPHEINIIKSNSTYSE